MRTRRHAIVCWSCSFTVLSSGCGTPPESAPEPAVLVTNEAVELEHASLTGAVTTLGRALGQPIRLAADAEPLGPCTRVTMFVPAGTSVVVARETAAKSLDELGFTWRDDAGSIVVARQDGAPMPAACLEREANRGLLGGLPVARASSSGGAPRSPDLKDPFGSTDDTPASDSLATALAAISAVDDTTWRVDMKAIDALPPELIARQARIVPRMTEGKAVGFRLFAIRPRSLPAVLGFQNGDTIVRVGDAELTGVESALAAYDALREETSIQVELERRGERRTHTYELVR